MKTIKLKITHKLALVLFALIINLLIYGYEYGANSFHSQDLPFIHKLLDPSLYQGDLYVQTMDSFPSLYIYSIALLAKVFPLADIHFVLFLVLKFLLLFFVYKLASFLFESNITPILAVFICAGSPLMNSFGILSDVPFMKSFLYHGSFIAPLFILYIILFLKERFFMSLSLLAFSYYFNALMSTHLAFMLFVASVIQYKSFDTSDLKKRLIQGWIAFLLILLPFVIFNLTKISSGVSSPKAFEYFEMWYPGHYFLLSWDLQKLLRVIGYILIFAFSIKTRISHSASQKNIKAFCLAIVLMWGLAFIVGDLLHWRLGIVMQFFRSDVFLLLLALIFAADFIQNAITSKKIENIVVAGLLIYSLVSLKLYLFPSRLFLTSVGIIAIFYMTKELKDYLVKINESETIRHTSKRIYLVIFIGIIFASHFNTIVVRLATKKLMFEFPIKASWLQSQIWARDNTYKEDSFVVPPYMNGFRSFSQRSVFVDRLDLAVMHWKAGIEIEWDKRIKELGYKDKGSLGFKVDNLKDPLTMKSRKIYASNKEKDFIRLSKKYGMDYVVTENNHILNFPLLYQNKYFSIYKIVERE